MCLSALVQPPPHPYPLHTQLPLPSVLLLYEGFPHLMVATLEEMGGVLCDYTAYDGSGYMSCTSEDSVHAVGTG